MVIRGKKETGRKHGYNSTTIYYSLKRDVVQRCPRCADLHVFLRSVGGWTWLLLLPLLLAFLFFNARALFGPNFNFFLIGGLVLGYILSGFIARPRQLLTRMPG